jgi:hypothetical protein
VDLSGSGGAADNPFSGFFTWDPTATPFETDPDAAIYAVEAYELIFNGIDKTAPGGGAVFVVNDTDAFGVSTVDGLGFGAGLESDPIAGDTLLLGFLLGPSSTWNTLSLPADYSFLSSLTTRLSLVSLEVPGEGDANDIRLGEGSFAVTQAPEPATLTLTALGLAGVVVRARRRRQPRG